MASFSEQVVNCACKDSAKDGFRFLYISIGIVVLVTVSLSIGQYIGQYLALRLIKSGIEYVILAGSSLFSLSEAEP